MEWTSYLKLTDEEENRRYLREKHEENDIIGKEQNNEQRSIAILHLNYALSIRAIGGS